MFVSFKPTITTETVKSFLISFHLVLSDTWWQCTRRGVDHKNVIEMELTSLATEIRSVLQIKTAMCVMSGSKGQKK